MRNEIDLAYLFIIICNGGKFWKVSNVNDEKKNIASVNILCGCKCCYDFGLSFHRLVISFGVSKISQVYHLAYE